MSKKTLPVSFISVAGLFLMMAFQNCGQSFQTRGDLVAGPGFDDGLDGIDTDKNIITEDGKVFAKGRIIVKFNSNASPEGINGALGKIGAKSVSQNVLRTLKVSTGEGASLIKVDEQTELSAIQALKFDPSVEYAEVDRLVKSSSYYPNDPAVPYQWHLSDMGVHEAWDIQRGAGMIIAVADSGIATNNVEMAGQVLSGYNTINDNSDTGPVNDHGTAVASTIVARMDNGSGMAGIAPEAKVVPIRITNEQNGWAYYSDMAEAVYYAGDNNIPIMNMSYPSAGASLAVMAAADYYHNQRNGLLFVSAGNTSADEGYYDTDDILYVSATAPTGGLTSFSSFGNYVDFAAPGEDITCINASGGTGYCLGTSFASPNAAAVAALIWAASPDLTNEEVEYLMRQSARDDGAPGKDPLFGHGTIDARVGVYMAMGMTPPPKATNQKPTVSITSLSDGQLLDRQRYSIIADANDVDGSIDRVEIFVNGELIKTDYSKTYKARPNFRKWRKKTVEVKVVAYDNKGDSSSHSISVRVK